MPPSERRHVLAIALAIAIAAAVASAAQIPSLDEVYRTASAGDLPRADAMMQEVLSAYPNSARAHYAYAQILAAEGRTATARSQLNQAEQIAPGLPFVSPQALAGLKRRLQPAPTPAPAPRPSHSGGIPWFWLLVGGGIVWFCAGADAAARRLSRPVPQPALSEPECSGGRVQLRCGAAALCAAEVAGGVQLCPGWVSAPLPPSASMRPIVSCTAAMITERFPNWWPTRKSARQYSQ